MALLTVPPVKKCNLQVPMYTFHTGNCSLQILRSPVPPKKKSKDKKVQGGPVVAVNGVLTPINGLIDRYLG